MSAKQERRDELLSRNADTLSPTELDELMLLCNVDVDEGMSRLYLLCKQIIANNPHNEMAQAFIRQREEVLRKRFDTNGEPR